MKEPFSFRSPHLDICIKSRLPAPSEDACMLFTHPTKQLGVIINISRFSSDESTLKTKTYGNRTKHVIYRSITSEMRTRQVEH